MKELTEEEKIDIGGRDICNLVEKWAKMHFTSLEILTHFTLAKKALIITLLKKLEQEAE